MIVWEPPVDSIMELSTCQHDLRRLPREYLRRLPREYLRRLPREYIITPFLRDKENKPRLS
jgi:hypothetical protein